MLILQADGDHCWEMSSGWQNLQISNSLLKVNGFRFYIPPFKKGRDRARDREREKGRGTGKEEEKVDLP
jgi:hypothetical protein